MKKQIVYTILGLIGLVGILGGIKSLQIGGMIAAGNQFTPLPETVTTAGVRSESWETLLTSVGSLAAVQGVTVTAELTGKIVRIVFEPGTMVKSGDLLLQQDTSSEAAQLRAAEAAVEIAKINLDRSGKLLAKNVVSRSEYDNLEAQLKEAVAQADNLRATIAKKTIRAPFAGRLGIRLVNLGQVLNAGDAIVSLQSIDPIFVNFLLPQQQFSQLRQGLAVRVTSDAFPDRVVEGKITAINPEVEVATRNIRIQATLANSEERLRPGMFVNVSVVLPARQKLLTIPATAVFYASYGDSVFVVDEQPSATKDGSAKVVRQQIVQLGERRGDFVAVLSGLKEGDTIVSTGVFKLRTGQAVVVDNTLAPEFKLSPRPENS